MGRKLWFFMVTERFYLKKTITEAEIRVRVTEVVEDYSSRLSSAVEDGDHGAACHYAGVVRGLKLALAMAGCYFENIESQSETDTAVRRMLLRALEL